MEYVYEITAILDNGVQTVYGDYDELMKLINGDVVLQAKVKCKTKGYMKAHDNSLKFTASVIEDRVTTYRCLTEEEMFTLIHIGLEVTEISPCLECEHDADYIEEIKPMKYDNPLIEM